MTSQESQLTPAVPTTLVIGHRNPDMDAIAAAVGLAWVLDNVGPDHYVAGRTGEINAQTTFAINHFKAAVPELIANAAPLVGDVVVPLAPIQVGQPLRDVAERVASSRTVPVVAADNTPLGLIDTGDLFTLLAPLFSAAVTGGESLNRQFEDMLRRPVESLISAPPVTLPASAPIYSVVEKLLPTETNVVIVVDAEGKYLGVCHKRSLIAPPPRKLVLVDHNELTQAVEGAAHAELIEVLDHHRLGNPSTTLPIRFIADPVGSSSTLVAERAFAAGLTLPAPIAGLLLSGIFSDTLVFKSPTSTARDQQAAEKLAPLANLITPEAVAQYGAALLASGAGLNSYTAEQIVSNDFKQYEAGGHTAGVVQAEVAGFDELPGRIADLTAALEKMRLDGKLSLAMLMVTDIIGSNSRLLAVGEPQIIAGLPYPRLTDGTFDAPGMVSRKKQLLPVVLDVLAKA